MTTFTTATTLPAPRGPLSESVLSTLLREQPRADLGFAGLADADPLGDDLQLALHLCYELHYQGLPGVSADWEWDPELLRLRGALEARFLAALRENVPGGADVPAARPRLGGARGGGVRRARRRPRGARALPPVRGPAARGGAAGRVPGAGRPRAGPDVRRGQHDVDVRPAPVAAGRAVRPLRGGGDHHGAVRDTHGPGAAPAERARGVPVLLHRAHRGGRGPRTGAAPRRARRPARAGARAGRRRGVRDPGDGVPGRPVRRAAAGTLARG